jgi:subtilase family serine protease
VLDNTNPPSTCDSKPNATPPVVQDQLEIGWIDSGGGFSAIFPRPDYQTAYEQNAPAGSTPIPASSRGMPDIAYNASSRTGVLIYVSLPPVGDSGAICGSAPCSTGWYIIGGTSAGSPQWAGLVALADQIAGHRLGFINPTLYQLASNPSSYASDFYDVTVGGNTYPSSPIAPTGYNSTLGWDPVTGLGTPNAANLLPALAAG